MGIDSSPPVVTASSYTGNVKENAAPGTPVYDDYPEPRPVTLTVTDPDLVREGIYATEKIFLQQLSLNFYSFNVENTETFLHQFHSFTQTFLF